MREVVGNTGTGAADNVDPWEGTLDGYTEEEQAEIRKLAEQWDKGSFDNAEKSIIHHAKKHGSDDILKYLRRAANFNKRGARKIVRRDGTIRYEKSSGEFIEGCA